ncbi:MAG: phosphatase PAP2 family protein, partial [Treponema sp.]|nr:phosphatase PAP2 family protein [Treponema sp.]
MKKYLALFFAVFVTLNCFAESVYSYDLTKDLVIGSVSLGLTASSFFIHNSTDNSSKDAVLQRSSVNAFDRGLVFEFNKPLDLTSDIAVYGILALPVLSLAGNVKNANAWITYGVMYAESALLVFGTTEVLKNAVLRYRPYFYYGEIPSGREKEFYQSFPSRHTAFAFMSAGFLSSTFSAEYPDSPWRIPIYAVSYTLAAGVGASRIFSGNHF